MKKKEKLYCLVQDQDCHWYLILASDKEWFYECEAKGEEDDYTQFNDEFGDKRIGGDPSNISFIDPLDE